jgi:acetyl-CoA synthetase
VPASQRNAAQQFPSPCSSLHGRLQITENALDRHIAAGYGDHPAVTFEADDGASQTFTFAEVLEQANATALVLQSQGVRKGDRVSICMPMIPQLLFSMLACARIGAIHSVIFAGFSAEAISERIVNCRSDVVMTADAGVRGGKIVPLKASVDRAVDLATKRGMSVRKVLVTHRAGDGAREGVPGWVKGRDVSLDDALAEVFRNSKGTGDPTVTCAPAEMDAEDPLFILYTSGSTGTPKGVLHTTGGYMVWAGTTFKHIFDTRPSAAQYSPEALNPKHYSRAVIAKAAAAAAASNHSGRGHHSKIKPDLHFCTADLGWVTGHSYIAYAPLLNGTHTLLFEGTPTYPQPDRLWDIVEKHKATTLYTAPTAIRALMVHGDEPVAKHDLSSLRILGSVGEPINPEAWRWLHKTVGRGQCPIVDTWWQTETGGVMITSLPFATHMKPGMATKPFFGVDAKVVRADGTECADEEGGFLVIDQAWPGMMRGIYGDTGNERFKKTYFSQMPGRYFTGDGAVRDADGDIQIIGRTDDVLNVSGHRLGTAEIEAALSLNASVVEAAVVGFPHAIKGEGIYAYVILKNGVKYSPALEKELINTVRKQIGPIATPDAIHVTADLPKTRSGKIMRRILRKIALGESDATQFGDTSTLADPSVVSKLIETRKLKAKAA